MTAPNILALLREGIAAAKGGDKARTRSLLGAVVEADPGNEVAWLWLSSVSDDPSAALRCLDHVLRINPAHPRARAALNPTRLQAAASLAKGGDRRAAVALFSAVLAEEPANEAALLWLGGLIEDANEAAGYLERALRIDPNNKKAQEGLARLRARRPKPPAWRCPFCAAPADAMPAQCLSCRALLALDKIDLLASANLQADEKKLSAAVGRISAQEGVECDPLAQMHLGLAYLNLRRFPEAIQHLHEAGGLETDDPKLRQALRAVVKWLPALQRKMLERQRQSVRKTILVVDDSPTIRKVVSVALEPTAHRVVTAADASEALSRIRSAGAPDLVLLDVNMPGMDGYELCRLLRQTKETAKVPIVMLSGRDGFFSKMRGSMAGSTDYVTKPFTAPVLLGIVARYCGVMPELEEAARERSPLANGSPP